MKKRYYLLMLAASLLTISSCSRDEIIVESPKPEIEVNPDVEKKVLLGITATLNDIVQARSILTHSFLPNHNIGVFFDEENISFIYDGKNWNAESQVQVKQEKEVYAYSPYSKGLDNNQYIIDLNEQKDVLWGKTKVTPDSPTANFEMQHALALVQFKIVRDEYTGEGNVSNMIIHNVYSEAKLNLHDGELSQFANKSDLSFSGSHKLTQEDPILSEFILFPNTDIDGVSFSMVLDGNSFTYEIPNFHTWEAGKMYTYTIKVKEGYNTTVEREDVPIDVEYWSKHGKTDDIILKDIDFNDDENAFLISPNYTTFGYDCYQNEGKPFGVTFEHFGEKVFKGKIRFVFMKEGQIVEKFQPADIEINGGWRGKVIQCYVTSTPGTYELVPLFQREGEVEWFKAVDYSNSSIGKDEWMVDVKTPASPTLPSLRDIQLENEKNTNFLVYSVPFNQPFNVVYILSNKAKNPMKGEIKAVWERTFKLKGNSYYPGMKVKNGVNDNEWEDEVGRISVDIKAGARFWKGIMQCEITKFHAAPTDGRNVYCTPVIHLYWKGEGETQWTLLRLDADYLFNRNYNGPDIWDETLNFINISIEDWWE